MATSIKLEDFKKIEKANELIKGVKKKKGEVAVNDIVTVANKAFKNKKKSKK